MQAPLVTGMLYGFVLMLSTGPSFFYLIKVGIEKGFRKAMLFALGIFISDVLLLSVIFIGLKPLFEDRIFQQTFSLCSGIIIAVFGLTMLLKKKVNQSTTDAQIVKNLPSYMYAAKGIGINLFNPFTIIMWVGVLGSVSPNEQEFVLFTAGVLGVILTADIMKAYLAKLIGKMMTPHAVLVLNRILGLAFMLIGAYFIYLFYNSYSGGGNIQIDIPSF